MKKFLIIIFIAVSVGIGCHIEKNNRAGFEIILAGDEETEQYNDTGNRIINGLININAAEKDQLESVDGIGEKTAQKIIDYRTEHGAFKSLDELKNIKGIGDKKLDKLRDKLCAD